MKTESKCAQNQHQPKKGENKMQTSKTQTSTDYRNLPIGQLQESPTNPRRRFSEETLKELAVSFKTQGVLQPLVGRELGEGKYEIVVGARRLRAARLAELDTVPVRVVQLSDAAAIEAQVVENLQREDVHPLEEALGFRSLLDLNNSPYTIASIAGKAGKSEAYVQGRIKLTELIPPIAETFLADRITIGHALLIAKLPHSQQQEAFNAAFRQMWMSEGNKQVLIPVRELAAWIESNILMELAAAPFSKSDETLLSEAGSCANCPKRTGFNALLFSDVRKDSCTDPQCFRSKVDAHVAKAMEKKPELVQISSAWSSREGAPLGRNRYMELELRKATTQSQTAKTVPAQKPCEKMREAIVMDGGKRGQIVKVCADPSCRTHHGHSPSPQAVERDRAEQRKRMEKEKLAITIRHRILANILKSVAAPLKKADLQLLALTLLGSLPHHLLSKMMQRLRPVAAAAKGKTLPKSQSQASQPTIQSVIERCDDNQLNRLLLECVLLDAAYHVPLRQEQDILATVAKRYRVNSEAIAETVKKEFAAQQKKAIVRKNGKPTKKQPAA